MRTLEELGLVPAWVNPDHMVATAIHVMQGHKINAVAVVSGTGLDGLITLERALAIPKFSKVETIVQPVGLTLDVETSVRAAAKQFIERDALYAAVYREREFRGLLTTNMLLREIGQSWDPLTSLPWSNRLRDWGTEELESGHEITVVFVDIDDFGLYNKKHGHIVGDRILKLFAAKLRGAVDRHNDILVRYGGDEFVIGTRLDRFTAERRFGPLADLQLTVDDVPDPVTVSVGFAGGMRTNEREHAHVPSMLDNLINLASQDCTRRKEEKSARKRPVETPAVEAPAPSQPVADAPREQELEEIPYDVRLVSVDEDDPSGPVAVTLRIGGTDGTAAAMPEGRTLLGTVAVASCRAIERARPDVKVDVSATVVDTAADGEKTVTVVGSCTVGEKRQAMTATRPVSRDVHRAVADAVAAAFVSLRV
jgi:diguanylate cyclase (GGDEF)-like protein